MSADPPGRDAHRAARGARTSPHQQSRTAEARSRTQSHRWSTRPNASAFTCKRANKETDATTELTRACECNASVATAAPGSRERHAPPRGSDEDPEGAMPGDEDVAPARHAAKSAPHGGAAAGAQPRPTSARLRRIPHRRAVTVPARSPWCDAWGSDPDARETRPITSEPRTPTAAAHPAPPLSDAPAAGAPRPSEGPRPATASSGARSCTGARGRARTEAVGAMRVHANRARRRRTSYQSSRRAAAPRCVQHLQP